MSSRDTRDDSERVLKERSNVVKVHGSREAAAANRRKRKAELLKKRILMVLAIIVIVAVGVLIYKNSIKEYNSFKLLTSTEIIYESNSEYVEFGGNLLKYTSEGVSYINASGETVWTAGIDMKVPIAETKGDYAVVADKGGNIVRVFNTKGAVSEVTMPYSIVDIDVASQGAFVVSLESDKTNYINMYSKDGKLIYDIKTSIDKSGYPIDMTVSNDGEKLFSSYFRIDGVDTKINLTAYNFGEVGQNDNADRIVGGTILDDEIVPKVQFVDNDTIAAFSDKRIIIYSMKEVPEERAVIYYNENDEKSSDSSDASSNEVVSTGDVEIQSIFYSSAYVGTIEKNKSGNSLYTMKIYNLSGKKECSYDFSLEYDNIYAADSEIIITGGTECLIISKDGRTRFSYAFDSQIKNMIPSSGRNQYIITFTDRTDSIKLKAE